MRAGFSLGIGSPRLPTPIGGPGLNPTSQYLTGNTHYGAGRSMPNIGAVSGQGLLGYSIRDNQAATQTDPRKNAIMRRLGSQMYGDPYSPNYSGYMPGLQGSY